MKSWIKMGAGSASRATAKGALPTIDIEAGRKFWAFQKPRITNHLPRKNPAWAKRPLDQFILTSSKVRV